MAFLEVVVKIRPKKVVLRDAGITLLNAMADGRLYGPWFKQEHTWRSWRVFLRALFGLPMLSPKDRAIYQKHTQRSKTPTRQAREGWLVVGRRGGKSFITALIASYLAAFRDYREFLAPGERCTVMVLASDRKQARVVMRYVTALFEQIPLLNRMVERMGAESIDLNNSVTVEVATASFRTTRGYTIGCCIADELAYWHDDATSANPASAIIEALLPGMSTIPGALLLGISSPYSRNGILWERYRDCFGHDDSDVLVWQAASRDMNPTLPQSVVDRAYADDPASAAAEYGGEFRSDIEGFLDPAWIEAAVVEGLHEIAPDPTKQYVAYCDPSGGSADAFTLGISHNEGGKLVLDVLRVRHPPFNPLSVCAEFAATLKRYGLSKVVGDRYSAQFVVSAFQEHGIYYEPSERSTSDVYLEILPHFAQGAVQLLDNRVLLNELRQLERRTGRGKDVISHPPRGHDDAACSACGSCLLAVTRALTAEEFKRGAITVTAAECRGERDERLAGMGLVDLGDTAFDDRDSPFNLGDSE
jgi:hypothetical protein